MIFLIRNNWISILIKPFVWIFDMFLEKFLVLFLLDESLNKYLVLFKRYFVIIILINDVNHYNML